MRQAEPSAQVQGDVEPDRARAPLVLALDVGSSSTRAAIVDRDGRRLRGTLNDIPYKMETTVDGGACLDPAVLLEAICKTVDRSLAAAPEQVSAIAGAGISTFWHSLIGLDASNRPLTPVYTWADIRAAAALPGLRKLLDVDAYHARVGAILHSSYPLAKLAWLAQQEPELAAQVARWCSFGEYLLLELVGKATCSVSMASGTGLFDEVKLCWDDEALAAARVTPERLSEISDHPVSGLRDAYAQRWPALKDIPWFPALGDGACSNLGSGAYGRDRLAVMVGTTGAMRLLWEGEPAAPPPGLWFYRLDARHGLLGGALSAGGNLLDWLRHHLQLPSEDGISTGLSELPPDGHGLTWLPFLAGERSPDWLPDARSTITGLSLDTTPLEILQAGLEAVAFRFGLVHEEIETASPGDRTVIASGNGLLRNPIWMQMVANVLNEPVLASTEAEASLKGAAVMALARLASDGDQASSAVLKELGRVPLDQARHFEPDADAHRIYQKAIKRQQSLARVMAGWG
ncbi:MAG TPA: gluconokinase [Thermomicrobiaceae bacterium]|nr:gluconokinase [Thermomicrobiaceae bacterium]